MTLSSELGADLSTSTLLALIYHTIFFYDYILTFTSEVRYFWFPNKLTFPAFLFFLNRYVSLAGNIIYFLESFMTPPNDTICEMLIRFNQPYIGVAQLIACTLLIFRVSAMYGHHKGVLAVLVCFLLGIIATVIRILVLENDDRKDVLVVQGLPGCFLAVSDKSALRYAVPWSMLLGFDFLIFILTLVKTLKMERTTQTHIVYLMARDGSMYFAVIFLANVANVITTVLAPPLLKSSNTTLTNVLSAILINRLMINLRAAHAKRQTFSFGNVNVRPDGMEETIPLRSSSTFRASSGSLRSPITPMTPTSGRIKVSVVSP